MPTSSWSVPAVAEKLPEVRRNATNFAHANGVPNPPLHEMRLAISEAATNAVLHAFRDREQPGTLFVSVDVQEGEFVEVIVRDDGMGMSPRSDSPGLGLGSGLIAAVADFVEHRAPVSGAGFELVMRFKLDPA